MTIIETVLIYLCTLHILMNNNIATAITAADRHHSSLDSPLTFQRQSTHGKDTNLYSHQIQQLCSKTETYSCSQVMCSKDEILLAFGCCATYSEDTRLLSVTTCGTFQSTGYNMSTSGYILLPRNLSLLNHYMMCGPLNRKGLVCSECADGFGPSVTSFQYTCANCTDAWYGVPLFLFLEFFPITLFYLIILVFQISVTSAPMPCFIMYAQFIITAFKLIFHSSNPIRNKILIEDGDFRLDIKVIYTFYGLFNLDFFQFIIPPFCVSSKLKFFYTTFFGYISAIYPVCLICLTWVCVELPLDH